MENLKNLSSEIFESAMDYLPRLIDGLSKASDHFKNNENLEGFQILSNANEGLMWFNQVVLGLPVLLPQGEDATDIQSRWQAYVEALNQALDSIERMDVQTISQLLENEVVPFIRLVYDRIGRLKQEAQYTQ